MTLEEAIKRIDGIEKCCEWRMNIGNKEDDEAIILIVKAAKKALEHNLLQ